MKRKHTRGFTLSEDIIKRIDQEPKGMQSRFVDCALRKGLEAMKADGSERNYQHDDQRA
jgi:hypothetical protein